MATERKVRVRLEADPGQFIAGMMAARAAVKGLTSEIDTSNDRTAWLAQSILALGPAITPLGAAVVPVISGLVTQMTLAAGAAGTAALAFNGMGDGLKAVNEYQLEPTAANFEKMRLAMEKVGPDGAEFITFLDSIGPKFTELQMVAREGMFPGMQEGLESFLDLLPRVRNIVSDTAEAMGDLSAQAGAGLAGEGFADFFDYMDRTAKPMLIEMGQTLGNFIEGIAAMIVAFEPLTADFSSGFLNMSKSFSDWAHGLEDSSSFADFIDYVQQSVPKALDFLSSLSDAFVEIIKAAAPVGDAMLPALSALFDVIGALANSPLGPVFLTAAAAMSVYGRAVALSSITTGGLGKVLGQSAYNTAGLSKAFTAGLPPLNAFTNSMYRLGQAQQHQSLYTQATNKMMGGWIKTLAPAAAGMGLLAVAMSDLDDKAGLTKTTMGALLGSMAGLKGGAIGATIGLILDFRSANDQLEASFGRIDKALARGIPGMETAREDIEATGTAIEDLIAVAGDKSVGGTLERAFSPQYWREAAQHFGDFSNMYQDEIDEINAKNAELVSMQEAIYEVGMQMGKTFITDSENRLALEDLAAVAERAAPAMDALGLSWAEIASMDMAGQDAAGKAIQEWIVNAETAEGRTRNLAGALGAVDEEFEGTAEAADRVAAALDDLFGPTLGLEEATDAWHTSLQQLRQDLDKVAGFDGYSKAAKMNRDITRQYVEDSTERLVALAGVSTTTEKDMAKAVAETRKEFIASGIAAGFSAKEIAARANELGLTPKMVRTIFEAAGIDIATLKAREARKAYLALPKEVRTALRTEGVPKTVGEIDALVKKYKLTEQERRALISLKDNASGAAAMINRILDNAARDRTATITTINRVVRDYDGTASGPLPKKASGGQIFGPGTTTSDSIPALLSNREYVIKAAAVDHYGADFFDRANAMRLASGGLVGSTYARTSRANDDWSSVAWSAANNLANALDRVTDDLDSDFGDALQLSTGILRSNIREQRQHTSELSKQTEMLKKIRDEEKARLADLKAERKSLADATAGNFKPDAFGNIDLAAAAASGAFGTAFGDAALAFANRGVDPAEQTQMFRDLDSSQIEAYLASLSETQRAAMENEVRFDALNSQMVDAVNFTTALEQAVANGLDGGLFQQLATSGNVGAAELFATFTAEQIASYEQQFNNANLQAVNAGQYAGQAAFGAAINAQTAVVQEARDIARDALQSQRRSEKRLERLEHLLEKAPKDTGREVGKALDDVAAGSRR